MQLAQLLGKFTVSSHHLRYLGISQFYYKLINTPSCRIYFLLSAACPLHTSRFLQLPFYTASSHPFSFETSRQRNSFHSHHKQVYTMASEASTVSIANKGKASVWTEEAKVSRSHGAVAIASD